MAKTRDKIVHAVASWVLSFGTQEYRDRLEYTYALGFAELERRLEETR